MRIDPGMQGLQALLSLACGAVLGFLYDLMTACLRRSRLEKLHILFYIPYSLLAAVLLFLLGSIAGRGQLRLFMLLGMLLGGLSYLLALRRLGSPLAAGIAALLACLVRFLLKPFRLLWYVLKKIFNFAKKYFHFAIKWSKIHLGFLDSLFSIIPAEAKHEAAEIGHRYRYGAFDAGAHHLRGSVSVADECAHRRCRAGQRRAGRRSAGAGRHQRFP
jgi:hypothetical protein